MSKKDESTILERVAENSVLMSVVLQGLKSAHQSYLSNLILKSGEIVARRNLPWEYKSLLHHGEEDFAKGGSFRVMYADAGDNINAWHQQAAKALAGDVSRSLIYEDEEGLVLFVRDGEGFRPATRGDPAYEFVKRLYADGNLSDIAMDKPTSWAEELFVSKHNLDAYACFWHDLDYLSTPGRAEMKRVRREAVWKETLRRMGHERFIQKDVPEPHDWGRPANRKTEPEAEKMSDRPMSVKERSNLLAIIGGLLELIQSPRPNRSSDAAIIREMLDNYGDRPAISKRNLEDKFAQAKRAL